MSHDARLKLLISLTERELKALKRERKALEREWKKNVWIQIENYIRQNKAATAREIIKGTDLTARQVGKNLFHLVKKGRIKRFKVSFSRARKFGQAKLFGFSPVKYIYYVDRQDFLIYLASKLKVDLSKRVLLNIFSKRHGPEGFLTEEEVNAICKMKGFHRMKKSRDKKMEKEVLSKWLKQKK